jgi:hypothetical protein
MKVIVLKQTLHQDTIVWGLYSEAGRTMAEELAATIPRGYVEEMDLDVVSLDSCRWHIAQIRPAEHGKIEVKEVIAVDPERELVRWRDDYERAYQRREMNGTAPTLAPWKRPVYATGRTHDEAVENVKILARNARQPGMGSGVVVTESGHGRGGPIDATGNKGWTDRHPGAR